MLDMDSKTDLKLLYVEDDIISRELTQHILEYFFETIIVAVNGEDGFQKFKENDFDIIITDISMPKMDGLEMTSKIKEINPQIPILVLSAHTEAKHLLQGIKLGVEGYLLKPIEIDQFKIQILKTINNIKIQKENKEYKKSLETKVQEQLEELKEQDRVLMEQSKMAAMGEILDAVAHQWKQPLNLISLYSQLLFDGDEIAHPEHIKKYQEKIGSQIAHLVSTIDEFRKFFKADDKNHKIDLKLLLDKIAVLLKDDLIKNHIQLNISCSDEMSINAIENDIKHLIINLINNAKDEIVNSELENEKRIIDVTCIKDNLNTMLKVKDNGNGIPEDVIDNIFKLNFTTKGEVGGTGVGLYLCKLITDKYGAKISAENDNGALFSIIF